MTTNILFDIGQFCCQSATFAKGFLIIVIGLSYNIHRDITILNYMIKTE